ncbi:MAG: ABC transporter substrate-binding protein [Eubacteriales bacterium]|nr:ABC transporter substrate-binding protein [Eubacteriales bacterium]
MSTEQAVRPASLSNDADSKPPSGVMRLAWSNHQNLNPLLDYSEAGQAAQSLVFESLFVRDSTFAIQSQLVKSYSFSRDRLQLTLLIDPVVTFHNGTPLTAADVLACLNFIQDHAEQSPYAAALHAFANGFITNEETLVLQLNDYDPEFLYALNFPILPAAQLNVQDGDLIAGTGLYAMSEFSSTGELTLDWADESTKAQVSLQHIILKPYESTITAMRALEEDEIDLVWLSELELAQYQSRNSLRLDRYISDKYIDLIINPQVVPEKNNPVAQLNQKYYFRSARLFSSQQNWPGQPTDVPIPASHAAFNGQTFSLYDQYPQNIEQQVNLNLPDNRIIKIVVAENQPVLAQIARQIATWLTDSGYLTEVRPLSDGQYQQALSNYDYDLIVRESELPASLDPQWLYENTAEVSSGLDAQAANGYDELSPLAIGGSFFSLLGSGQFNQESDVQAASESFQENLKTQAIQSNTVGLMQWEEAIAYGDRVMGQLQPSLDLPYNRIEDLWIWSGLSSSSY